MDKFKLIEANSINRNFSCRKEFIETQQFLNNIESNTRDKYNIADLELNIENIRNSLINFNNIGFLKKHLPNNKSLNLIVIFRDLKKESDLFNVNPKDLNDDEYINEKLLGTCLTYNHGKPFYFGNIIYTSISKKTIFPCESLKYLSFLPNNLNRDISIKHMSFLSKYTDDIMLSTNIKLKQGSTLYAYKNNFPKDNDLEFYLLFPLYSVELRDETIGKRTKVIKSLLKSWS